MQKYNPPQKICQWLAQIYSDYKFLNITIIISKVSKFSTPILQEKNTWRKIQISNMQK